MNRSVERVRLAATAEAASEVLVAAEFVHPRRGPVRCPAAPLLAAHLHRLGLPARISPLPRPRFEPGDATLFATSYVDRAGCVVGLGAAASHADTRALVAAEQTVAAWTAVLRTRRILVTDTDTRCTAPAPDQGNIGCPLTALTRERAREYADRGDTVLLIGHAADAARANPTGQGPGTAVVVPTTNKARLIHGLNGDHLSFVVVPGIPIEDSLDILRILRSRFPRLRGQHPDEFCYAASDRREASRSVAAASDLVLICSETNELEPGEQHDRPNSPTGHMRQLSQADQIRADWLRSAATVGIVADTRSRSQLVDDIVEVLSGLGPSSVAHRRVTTVVHARAGHRPTPQLPVALVDRTVSQRKTAQHR